MMPRRRRNPSKAALVSNRSHISFLELIREMLGKDNLETLQRSCFGNMFLIHELQFQGQLYNLLIRHIVKSSKYHNCISFLINGLVIDFTQYDFALITGLKFGHCFDLPVESEFHRAVFNKKTSLTLEDIIVAFKIECSKCNGSSLLSLKLAYLLILYGILLVVGGKKNSIDVRYLHLIDDLESFNSFPWGLVAYLCLVSRTHRAAEVLENLLKNDKRVAFDANGFVLALQVWAYEVIPIIARNSAFVLPGTDHIVPRIRRWTAPTPIKFDLLQQYLAKASGETLTPITPSTHEQQYMSSLGLLDMNFVTGNGDSTPTNGPNDTTLPPTLVAPAGENIRVNFLASRVAELEKLVCEIRSSIPTGSNPSIKISGGLVIQTTTPQIEGTHHIVAPIINPRKTKKVHDIVGSHMCKRSTKSRLDNDQRAMFPKQELMHVLSNMKNSPEGIKIVPQSSDNQTHDPNEGILQLTNVVAYEAWRAKVRKSQKEALLRFPCRKVGFIDESWFDTLWSQRGWLNTSHMDALLNELLIARDKAPGLYRSHWSAVEMIAWGALTDGKSDVIHDRVGPYITGLQPAVGAIHWARLSNVYGIGHVHGDHWVCYELSLDHYMCTIYDSRSTSSTWNLVSKLFHAVCKRIWALCDRLGVWALRNSKNTHQTAFNVVRYEHPPQQTNNSDCGVMAMKFMECLVTGNDVDIIDPDRCGVFRHSYCGKIFALCEEDTNEYISVSSSI